MRWKKERGGTDRSAVLKKKEQTEDAIDEDRLILLPIYHQENASKKHAKCFSFKKINK